jgi:hypothetical protein
VRKNLDKISPEERKELERIALKKKAELTTAKVDS